MRIGTPEGVVVPGKEPGRHVEGEPVFLRPTGPANPPARPTGR
ncbi:MAG: hypothetical protein ACYDBP_14535 [Leptospirales bacterium]